MSYSRFKSCLEQAGDIWLVYLSPGLEQAGDIWLQLRVSIIPVQQFHSSSRYLTQPTASVSIVEWHAAGSVHRDAEVGTRFLFLSHCCYLHFSKRPLALVRYSRHRWFTWQPASFSLLKPLPMRSTKEWRAILLYSYLPLTAHFCLPFGKRKFKMVFFVAFAIPLFCCKQGDILYGVCMFDTIPLYMFRLTLPYHLDVSPHPTVPL